MKIKFYSVIAVFTVLMSTVIFACSKKVQQEETEQRFITLSREINAPGLKTKAGEAFIITAKFDLVQEEVVDFDVPQEILDMAGITKLEFKAIVEGDMDLPPMFADVPNDYTHSKCLIDCDDRYTDSEGNKIKGRNTCKFGCWITTAIQVGETVLKYLNPLAK